MSADPDNNTPCPNAAETTVFEDCPPEIGEKNDELEDEKSKRRTVSFPDDDHIVTQYFEPANPWRNIPSTSRSQLVAEYLESCRRHSTTPIDSVLQQIRDLPENAIGGEIRASRLTLSCCEVKGTAAADALEAVLRKVQFRRIDIDQAVVDDEGAEALFDMIEYYESANVVCVNGERHFGIRGWQATARLIKRSAELCELEVSEGVVEGPHAIVLERALRPRSCGLRSLTLRRASLQAEPLLCLVSALKSNTSVRELRLGDNGLTPADAVQLGCLLRVNCRLQLLDLSNNMIQDAGFEHLADALVEQADLTPPSAANSPLSSHYCPLTDGGETRGLVYLVLWNNQLTRNCAPHLGRALRFSQSLSVLNMGHNAVGTESVAALCGARALRECGLQGARLAPPAARTLHALLAAGRLRRLDLRDNKLGVEGLQAILSALETNNVATQIDLDDPPECTGRLSAATSEAATIAKLTREIRARLGSTPPVAPPARRISLTVAPRPKHQPSPEEERRGRLRSPAPSPAGSPIPASHSRFSVTRVTPDREPGSCSAPSRFKVVQVSEPPTIQVHPATNPIRKSTSRFSVTRNYDSMYDPVTPPPSPCPGPCTPANSSPETIALPIRAEETVKKCDVKTVDIVKNDDNIIKNDDIVSKNDDSIQCDVDDIRINDDKIAKCEVDINSDNVSVCVSLVNEHKDNPHSTDAEPLLSASETDISEVVIQVKDEKSTFDFNVRKDDIAMKQIEAITQDLGNLIQEFKELNVKSNKLVKNDCTQTDHVNSNLDAFNVPVNVVRANVVLKKNKSESSLDSPDLEVSRLMNKKLSGSPFCDSSSSLEVSGSSVESLNLIDNQHPLIKPCIIQETIEELELDRRKTDQITLSTNINVDSSNKESTSTSNNLLNMSVSSNESVSPIIFGKNKKIHDSLSSLEASVSSLDSGKQERVMMTSADSGFEYSLQNPSENKEDDSSNEGTLTNNSSLRESVRTTDATSESVSSPKRTSSLLDVPALKTKALGDRMRKISWVAPSPSFQVPKQEPEKEIKLNSHLEKLLSLFQHPLFSRTSSDDEKKSNTPPRKDSSLTSSFWSWGSGTEKEKDEKEDRDSLSEATDSTLSERVQVSFVDESFSKKLDSKTPSTDTDNTLSEVQTFQNSEMSEMSHEDKCRVTTDDILVQKCLVLSDNASSNGNKNVPRTSDSTDLIEPNDLNRNFEVNASAGDNNKNETDKVKCDDVKQDAVRPRSFAAVLKSSGSENSLEKQNSPDTGQPVDKLPTKIIRGIKENISPENTLTSSMTNTKALVQELGEKQVKNQPLNWDVTASVSDKNETIVEDVKPFSELAPIATIEEVCDESDNIALDFIDDPKFDDKDADSGVTIEVILEKKEAPKVTLDSIDLGKDALSYLVYENQSFVKDKLGKPPPGSLAQELHDAEIKEMLDLSPELIIDEALEVPEVFTVKEIKGIRTSPVIPERAKLVKSNSLEELSQDNDSPKSKAIAFKVPEVLTTVPRDIPERRGRLRTRSGSSPKSLPECLNKPCPLSKMDNLLSRKKKKVSSLGKMAKDSLLALNMSEEEIAEFRRSYKLTSVESLRSLESVSEDANSQNSMDYRCRSCVRTSQESLMSLDSISEDCRCRDECGKASHSDR